MSRNCTEVLQRVNVPKFYAPENFSLEKYMEKDHSIEKAKAAARAKGDYAELIRLNNIGNLEICENEAHKGRPRVTLSEAGKKIIALCKRKNVTAGYVASQIGISPNTMTYATKEGGKSTYNTYKLIADYFGVPVDWLMSGKEQQNG